MSIRPVKRLIKAKPTLEGAGVHLRRAFGFGNTSDFDPFLLLDDFRNDVPEDYLAGFPWHPHRGIETITYVLAGTVEQVETDDAGCGWATVLVRLTVDGDLKTDCTARIALPTTDDDNPWTRRGDQWKP